MKQFMWIFLSLTLSTFSQTPGGGVTDIDGNRYNSVIIGTQEWTNENLNVSKYTDGTIIPQVTDPTQWSNLTTGAWCYYNNSTANSTTYGKLYNWYAVAGIYDAASLANPALRKNLAPTGWRLPTYPEWSILINRLDPNSNGQAGFNTAGGKMKATGTLQAGTGLWESPNTDATNVSGFSGLPAGYRGTRFFYEFGYNGIWWSSSESGSTTALSHYLYYNLRDSTIANAEKQCGFSVRCHRDSSLSNTSFETSSLKLYPNPVVNILNIKVVNNLINQAYSIIDSLGRVVLNGKLNDVESTINVEQLSKGFYYLKISGYSSSKFIKE